jgi:DNA helicase-2/ATP-dependent DNA helicase PcrA
MLSGRFQDQAESPFLAEIPEHLLSIQRSPTLYAVERPRPGSQGVYSFFGRESPGGAPAPAPRAGPSLFTPRPAPSAASAPAYRERTVVPELDEAVPRRPVKRGSRVRHPTLGSGVVLELDGQGEDAKITVFFEKAGKRKLVARFANLELL